MSTEHGVASGPSADAQQPQSSNGDNISSNVASHGMLMAWMSSVPAKPSPLDLSIDRGESFRLWKRR